MYGLPSHTQLDFLVGQTLVQICFGLHDLRLNFDKEAAIHIESEVTIQRPSGEVLHEVNMPFASQRLAELLDQQITQVSASKGGCLELEFSGNFRLKIHDSNKHHESYRIQHAGTELVV